MFKPVFQWLENKSSLFFGDMDRHISCGYKYMGTGYFFRRVGEPSALPFGGFYIF
jgi:hypothetical protein